MRNYFDVSVGGWVGQEKNVVLTFLVALLVLMASLRHIKEWFKFYHWRGDEPFFARYLDTNVSEWCCKSFSKDLVLLLQIHLFSHYRNLKQFEHVSSLKTILDRKFTWYIRNIGPSFFMLNLKEFDEILLMKFWWDF